MNCLTLDQTFEILFVLTCYAFMLVILPLLNSEREHVRMDTHISLIASRELGSFLKLVFKALVLCSHLTWQAFKCI